MLTLSIDREKTKYLSPFDSALESSTFLTGGNITYVDIYLFTYIYSHKSTSAMKELKYLARWYRAMNGEWARDYEELLINYNNLVTVEITC